MSHPLEDSSLDLDLFDPWVEWRRLGGHPGRLRGGLQAVGTGSEGVWGVNINCVIFFFFLFTEKFKMVGYG